MKQKKNKMKSTSDKCSIKCSKKSKNFQPSLISLQEKVHLMKTSY